MCSCLQYLGSHLSLKAGRVTIQLWVFGMLGLLLNIRQVHRDVMGAINYLPSCTWAKSIRNYLGVVVLVSTCFYCSKQVTSCLIQRVGRAWAPCHFLQLRFTTSLELADAAPETRTTGAKLIRSIAVPRRFSILLFESLMHSADSLRGWEVTCYDLTHEHVIPFFGAVMQC